MLVLDDLKQINDIIKNLAEFVQTDDTVKPDFEEYLKTIGNAAIQSAVFTYIFERNLNNKSILTLYSEKIRICQSLIKKFFRL